MRHFFPPPPTYLGFSSAPGGPFSVLHYGEGCIDYWSKFEEDGAFSLVAALQFKGHGNPFPQSACLYERCYPTWMQTSLPRFFYRRLYLRVSLCTSHWYKNICPESGQHWNRNVTAAAGFARLRCQATEKKKKKKKKTKMWSHHTHTVLMKQISGDFEC